MNGANNGQACDSHRPESVGLHVPKLALGTAQFGLPYGLASAGRAVATGEVANILALAWSSGVDMLDTAPAYGNAEALIGEKRPAAANFSIVSKVRALCSNGEESDPARIIPAVKQSLSRLRIPRIDALLVHRAEDLMGPHGPALFRTLQLLKDKGLVSRIGVSVYDVETLDLLSLGYPLEVVQLPLNILDQRFAKSGAISRLADRGIGVHVRSVFLQGAILRRPDALPARFAAVSTRLLGFQQLATDMGLGPVAGALSFSSHADGIERVIIGVDSAANLDECIAAFAIAQTVAFDGSSFASDDLDIIDPRRWQ
jgi:aryl-alcohol dehydrogenase-like predicted oxidoreductase